MVGHGGSSAGSYLADPTSPIPSHCVSIVATSTLRVKISTRWWSVEVTQDAARQMLQHLILYPPNCINTFTITHLSLLTSLCYTVIGFCSIICFRSLPVNGGAGGSRRTRLVRRYDAGLYVHKPTQYVKYG